MRLKHLSLFVLATFLSTSISSCASMEEQRIKQDSIEVVDFKVVPFKIEDVKLLDGPFKRATDLNIKSLLNYEPDRFLAKFRSEAGLKPKAENYHGWEDNTIAGHSLGHYLTAIVLMYQTTGDPEFLKRVNYIVDELYECQQADKDGYLGAFPDGKKILEEQVAKGDIRSQGFNLNGIWVPFYTEHKVMDGLFHAYKYCGNKKALEINIKFADWLSKVVKNLNDDQIQKMLNCEHGGINESLAELYACTGNKKYLDLSHVFHHKAILDSLAHGVDVLPGKHANTQIPKLVGLARRYELTGSQSDRKAAEFFWDRVVNHHSYVTGGNCNHEYFGPADSLNNRLSDETTESCNVYNMLKLSEHLFEWDASPKVADYYERALFNHILSSQHPVDGRVIYNLSLDMGGAKVYQDPQWFTCCVGTGMENHSKYSKNIFYHNNEALYVFQYIASELNWKEKGVKVRQTTQFPDEQGTTIEFETEKPIKLALKIRYPHWAEKGIQILVNGKPITVNAEPGSFVEVGNKWKNGDKVEVKFPFSLRLETMPDNQNRVAVFNGPVVLAGYLGPDPDSLSTDPMYVPVIMSKEKNPEKWLTPVEGEANTFKTHDVGRPRDVVLKPFYKTHDCHYTIFWDTYSDQEWAAQEVAYQAELKKKKELELKTIDLFRIGEMQPEREHNFRDEKSSIVEYKTRKAREADREGWFAFDMKITKGQPTALAVEYWGGYTGSKTFDILVGDQIIATQNISDAAPGKFINIVYNIPESLTAGKDKVAVKFVGHEGHRAGPVFMVRTIKL
jgi:DUF1680 family protein